MSCAPFLLQIPKEEYLGGRFRKKLMRSTSGEKSYGRLKKYFKKKPNFFEHPKTLVNKKKCQSLKISYFPNFGALIPNLTIIFKFMEPISQCCQFCGFLVENYIFANILKF